MAEAPATSDGPLTAFPENNSFPSKQKPFTKEHYIQEEWYKEMRKWEERIFKTYLTPSEAADKENTGMNFK